MKNFIFLIFSSILISKTYSEDILVSTQLLRKPDRGEILLKIEVKNISDKTIKTVKNRTKDFKWENGRINSLGNYIIEIEKNENGKYVLFGPSADIDPFFQKEEFIAIQKDLSIADTLKIHGSWFSRNNERSFPIGMYRLRVHFKADMWSQQIMGNSNWIEFKIE